MITLRVLVSGLIDFTATRYQCMEKCLQIRIIVVYLVTIIIFQIGSATKLTSQLNAQLCREGLPFLADLHIAGLTVIQGMLCVSMILMGKVPLPTIIGIHTIGDMSFEREPLTGAWNRPVVRQGKTNLGHRTGIDAEGL